MGSFFDDALEQLQGRGRPEGGEKRSADTILNDFSRRSRSLGSRGVTDFEGMVTSPYGEEIGDVYDDYLSAEQKALAIEAAGGDVDLPGSGGVKASAANFLGSVFGVLDAPAKTVRSVGFGVANELAGLAGVDKFDADGDGSVDDEGLFNAEFVGRALPGVHDEGVLSFSEAAGSVDDNWWMDKVARGVGFGFDIASDPLTYASFGTGAAFKTVVANSAKKASKVLAEEAATNKDLRKSLANFALKNTDEGTASGLKKIGKKDTEEWASKGSLVLADRFADTRARKGLGAALDELDELTGNRGLSQKIFDTFTDDEIGGVGLRVPALSRALGRSDQKIIRLGGSKQGAGSMPGLSKNIERFVGARNKVRSVSRGRFNPAAGKIGGADAEAWNTFVRNIAASGDNPAVAQYSLYATNRAMHEAGNSLVDGLDDAFESTMTNIRAQNKSFDTGDQEAVNWLYSNPDKTLDDYAAEFPGATVTRPDDVAGNVKALRETYNLAVTALNDAGIKTGTGAEFEKDFVNRFVDGAYAAEQKAKGRKFKNSSPDKSRSAYLVLDSKTDDGVRWMTASEANDVMKKTGKMPVYVEDATELVESFAGFARRKVADRRIASAAKQRGALVDAVATKTKNYGVTKKMVTKDVPNAQRALDKASAQVSSVRSAAANKLPAARAYGALSKSVGDAGQVSSVQDKVSQLAAARAYRALRKRVLGSKAKVSVREHGEVLSVQLSKDISDLEKIVSEAQVKVANAAAGDPLRSGLVQDVEQLSDELADLVAQKGAIDEALSSDEPWESLRIGQFDSVDDIDEAISELESVVTTADEAAAVFADDVELTRLLDEAASDTRLFADMLISANNMSEKAWQTVRSRQSKLNSEDAKTLHAELMRATKNAKKVTSGKVPKATTDTTYSLPESFSDADLLRFNSRNGTGEAKKYRDIKELNEKFARSEIVNAFENSRRIAKEQSEVKDSYDKFIRFWKTGATVGRGPGFALRNFSGGVYNAMLVGANPSDFAASFKIASATRKARAAQAKRLRDLAEGKSLDLSEDVFGKTMRKELGSEVHDATGELLVDIYRMGTDKKIGVGTINDAIRGVQRQEDSKSAVVRAGRRYWIAPNANFSEDVENSLRFASFLAGMRRHGVDDVGQDLSAQVVRMSQFDYGDLSPTEKTLVRLGPGNFGIAPFFVWTQNNIPLQLRSLMYSPRYANTVVEGQGTLEDMFGDEEWDPMNAFMPDYLGEQASFITKPLFGKRFSFGNALPVNDLNRLFPEITSDQINTGLPGTVAMNTLLSGKDDAVSSLNPLIKGLVEAGTGRSSFTGREFGEREVTPMWGSLQDWVPGVKTWVNPTTGETMVENDFVTSQIKNLVPYLGQAERLAPVGPMESDRYQDRWWSTVASQTVSAVFGLGVNATVTDEQMVGGVRGATYDVDKQVRTEAAKLGIDMRMVAEMLRAGIPPERIDWSHQRLYLPPEE